MGKPDDENKTMTHRLGRLVDDTNPFLYRDERKESYIFYNLDGSGSNQNRPIDSSDVEDWLTGLLIDDEDMVPNSETILNVRRRLRAKAYANTRIRGSVKLYNRIAPDGDGGLYLDMVDGFGSVIHVNENRWRMDKPEKPIFRNYNHQLPLPDPLKGGKVKEILAFVNIKDRYNQILYLSALICCFIPKIEHPIFNVFGPYGSGKSSVLRVAKTFIDPSITDLLILNKKDEKELIKNLDDSYCVFFDNISYLTQDISDLLCKSVTGAGFSVRRLWT
ncbi:MAG: hypothetical protein JRC68_10400, partial [Deltaproteobacteria bacterium]|nr:hypothetical protein [Deltaproteobacteria bacterium]